MGTYVGEYIMQHMQYAKLLNYLMIQQKTLHKNQRIINHFKHTQRTEPNVYFVLTEQHSMYLLYWREKLWMSAFGSKECDPKLIKRLFSGAMLWSSKKHAE